MKTYYVRKMCMRLRKVLDRAELFPNYTISYRSGAIISLVLTATLDYYSAREIYNSRFLHHTGFPSYDSFYISRERIYVEGRFDWIFRMFWGLEVVYLYKNTKTGELFYSFNGEESWETL